MRIGISAAAQVIAMSQLQTLAQVTAVSQLQSLCAMGKAKKQNKTKQNPTGLTVSPGLHFLVKAPVPHEMYINLYDFFLKRKNIDQWEIQKRKTLERTEEEIAG